ncbi:HEPN domain-containing protein [Candidatus Nitronereus thalassa]|uniref:HEPN domain-containing protein n=1 Tax=Candidatus Nitronereus thalassa TaxID=3020898 RepID=A0ABU3K5T0_9BACT|nr:HEPN domain-containing protein [Candidatus Nitronereus thalassa]MDT7041772.1 HEPN domain-containing protein [Candidatus Nitronereus thalassa]
MNVQKHVEYWLNSAKEDWEIAQDLLFRNKTRHGLFFAHLALEKALKAQVCRTTKDVAPRIHALLRLAERANLDLTEETKIFLAEFDRYQLEGRYPENLMEPPDTGEAQEQMARAQEIYQWLTKQS